MLKGHKIFSKKWQEVEKDGEEWHKVEKLKIGDKKLKIVARKYGHLLKQAEKLKSREMKDGWWRMMNDDEWWRMMMNDDEWWWMMIRMLQYG